MAMWQPPSVGRFRLTAGYHNPPPLIGDARPLGSHAVVIGASIAGLLAARVLSDRFDQVTVVERDVLPDGSVPRKAVPQGQHLHILLHGGLRLLDDLFPGLHEELLADGAQRCGTEDGSWFQAGRYLPPFPSDYHQLGMTRPFLELRIRRRVQALGNVSIVADHAVTALVATSHGDMTRVTGVQVRSGLDGATRDLPADLVVDAGGRGSHAPAWLADLGYARPDEEKISIGVGYTTRAYRRRPEHAGGRSFACIQPSPRHETRGGAMFAIEEDRWLVTLSGWLGDHAPPDPDGFLAFAEGLPSPEIHDVIVQAEPIGEFMTYSFPASLRRRYDRMRRHPERFVVIGDALCSFNPIYGQGMSVRTLEALSLADALDGGIEDLPRRFYGRAARDIEGPWRVTAGGDFAFPGVTGTKPRGTDLVNRYVDALQRRASHDAVVCRALVEVTIMAKPPTALFAPRVAWRVLLSLVAGDR
jgi:2-polyprenyl-6-methoxyphenol hydroxylase-like FAD-dependent oxidoreductase